MTPETVFYLVIATFFVGVSGVVAHLSYKFAKIRMDHEDKVYAQRQVLIDLLTKADKKVVDEEVEEWLTNHLSKVRQDVQDELERAYGDAIRSIMKEGGMQ